MSIFSRVLSFAVSHTFAIGVFAAVVAAGAGGYALTHRAGDVKTVAAETGEFIQQVSVSGKVIASDDVALGFSQSGRITNISVTIGDTVRVGAVLASIENGDQRASVLQRRAAVDVQKAKLAALEAGTRPEQIALSESAVESDAVALQQANLALADAIRNVYTKADDAIRGKLDQFMSQPRTANPSVAFYTSDSSLTGRLATQRVQAEAALTAWQESNASLGSSSDVLVAAAAAQTRTALVQDILSLASQALSRAIPGQGITQSQLSGYASDIATARTNVDTALSALTSAVTAQKAAAASLALAEKDLALQKAGTVRSDIDAQAAQVRAAEADLASAEAQLAKTAITAPFSGVITAVSAVRGQITAANTPIISMIAPGSLQVETYVPESEISLVKTGNAASVRLDALPGRALAGKVASIDPAATVKDGVSTYRVVLVITDGKSEARSGMTGDVVIIAQKRESVLMVPQGVIEQRDGGTFVRVLADGVPVEREVTVGSRSSLGTVEILSGLTAGERVVVK